MVLPKRNEEIFQQVSSNDITFVIQCLLVVLVLQLLFFTFNSRCLLVVLVLYLLFFSFNSRCLLVVLVLYLLFFPLNNQIKSDHL